MLDALAQFSLDKRFIFFIECNYESIIPNMLTKAKAWNWLKEKGEMTLLFRMTMFLHYFQMLGQRVKQLKLDASDDALIQNLRSKGILSEDDKWAYLKWNNPNGIIRLPCQSPITSSHFELRENSIASETNCPSWTSLAWTYASSRSRQVDSGILFDETLVCVFVSARSTRKHCESNMRVFFARPYTEISSMGNHPPMRSFASGQHSSWSNIWYLPNHGHDWSRPSGGHICLNGMVDSIDFVEWRPWVDSARWVCIFFSVEREEGKMFNEGFLPCSLICLHICLKSHLWTFRMASLFGAWCEGRSFERYCLSKK